MWYFPPLIQVSDRTLYILISDFDIHITSLNASFEKKVIVDAPSELDIRMWIQIDEVISDNSVLQLDIEGAHSIKVYMKDSYLHLEHNGWVFNYQ